MPKKTERGDPLVSPGMVCYAGKQEKPFWFSSLVWFRPNGAIWCNNIFRTFVELFWSVQVVFKKTLTKSHDYSRLFSKEKRRLTSREQPKSAPYLRLKIVKRGPFGLCETPAGCKI